jgi:hypothetical protein
VGSQWRFVIAGRSTPRVAPFAIPTVCEFPQYWRYVGGDVGIPLTTVDEVPRVTARIQ